MIETERCIIRNWNDSDAESLYELCLDQDIRRSGITFFDSVEQSLNVIHLWQKRNDNWAVVDKDTKRLIGLVNLGDMNRYPEYKELEYAFVKEYRNKGYATELVKDMVSYGFSQLHLKVIAAWVHAYNTKSVRVLEKNHFTFEGRLRKHGRDGGDTLCYSILKEEWEAL